MPSFSRFPSRALLALALLCLAGFARADDAPLRAAIEKELANPAMSHGWTGVFIKSLDDNRVLYAQNADRLFIPASNMKLVVSATVTDVLPPDFRYETPVLRDGTLDGGVLSGNLYLKGSGDSTLEAKDLAELAKAVRAAGITRVTGDVVGDGSIFDNERLGYGWNWDDIPFYYSAEVDGLTVDRGTVHVAVTPGEVGQPPAVSLDPDAGYMLIRNAATTVPDAEDETLSIGRVLGTNIITVTGKIRRGNKSAREDITMSEPAIYTAYLFRKELRDAGVSVDGSARAGIAPRDGVQVASHASAPMSEILKLLNKPSDNLIAESLLKTLGALKKGTGSSAAGADVERDFLKKIGVDPAEILIVDGSGLSRMNLISPEALVKILAAMWTHPNRQEFVDSLPIAGVDGSLRNRMKGTPAAGKVLGKTGYVGKARNLSGYVTSRDGETYAFALLMNHYNGDTSAINTVQDHICEILANSTR